MANRAVTLTVGPASAEAEACAEWFGVVFSAFDQVNGSHWAGEPTPPVAAVENDSEDEIGRRSWTFAGARLTLVAEGQTHRFHLELGDPGNAELTQTVREWTERTIVNTLVSREGGRIWIHGACLCHADDPTDTLLLIGPSCAGKTTLSLALLTQGYQILTDDVILISRIGRVILPFPRRPRVRPGTEALLTQIGLELADVAEMAGRHVILHPGRMRLAPLAIPPRRVFFLLRDDVSGGSKRLSLSQGILSALKLSNLIHLDPTLALATEVFRDSRLHQLHKGDLGQRLEEIARVA